MTTHPQTINEVEDRFGRTVSLAGEVGLIDHGLGLPADDAIVIFDTESECYLVVELGTDPTYWAGY